MNRKLLLPLLGQADPYVPRDLHLVGRYAVGITWGDDHGSIYPFEALRRDCGCGACAALDAVSGAAGWPTAIEKTEGGVHVAWADAHESFYPYRELRGRCRCAACTGGH